MLNGTLEHVVKHSFIYGYTLSQPFAVYVDAYPMMQNKILMETDQLTFGEHSETVRILQHKLNKLSYYTDKIDGDMGILTENALKNFQKDNKLTVSGQADSETIFALIKAERERNLRKIEELSETIRPGMHNKDVKTVQESLQYFGYYKGEIDGIYGPLTEKALQIAEEEHDIELTKEVTASSLKTLYEKTEAKEALPPKKIKNKEVVKIKKAETQNSTNTDILTVAKSFTGTPYVWGGTSPDGFDCSGFIQYVYRTQGVEIPRTVSEIWNFSRSVASPSVGDLVFFQTYKSGPSHMGIYLGDSKFIHAGESRGVEISELENPYWRQRYLGAKRIEK